MKCLLPAGGRGYPRGPKRAIAADRLGVVLQTTVSMVEGKDGPSQAGRDTPDQV